MEVSKDRDAVAAPLPHLIDNTSPYSTYGETGDTIPPFESSLPCLTGQLVPVDGTFLYDSDNRSGSDFEIYPAQSAEDTFELDPNWFTGYKEGP
jgi:hypothetical protein